MAELARLPARELAQYRQRNEIPARSALYFGVPAGFAIGFAQTGVNYMLVGAGIFAIFAVLGFVHLIRNYPRGINAAQEEYREGDYPTIAYIAPFIPIAAPLVMAPLSAAGLVPEVELAPPIAGVLSGAWWAFGLPLGLWAMFSQSFRIGRRRINKILEKDPLEGVTQARLQLADAHSDILTALIAGGAVQGNTISARALSKFMQVDLDLVCEHLDELAQAGLVKLDRIALRSAPKDWKNTVTPTGVRCLYQLGKR
ncbi:hypothetical protein [Corynebacterium sp. p3-SID1241]|uniref:hypothetical protein n=1 Tax=Corynebacterium sp. p3-SID1241 TaxID=2916102 RepID=UPI0021A2979E|nr:hypothetical protein [Corynebacterium sp. p3-SID1241]MCT1428046.1 hypothetical protein [Corynebacterium sp. p3-SID1241]